MADALLSAVTESVLTKVISLADEQISRVLGVKEDLQSLAETLELIQALLSDAESKSTTNKTIEVWMKKLKEAAADVDDLLDEFAYQALNKKMQKEKKNKVRTFFTSSNPLLFRSKIVSKIKKINLQMSKIFKKAEQIGLRPAEIFNSPIDPRSVPAPLLTDPFVDDSNVVGRSSDMSEIVSQLTRNDEKNLSVIGIVGMGGQGKTTLAQLLMKNDEVKKHFEKRIWTCVSDDFNVDRVLKDMLQSLTGEPSQLTNREAIVKKLSTGLQGKRFLLVLDEVWNEDSQLWDCMNNSLQAIGGSKGSKLIVTTRNEAVVMVMKGFIYRLGVLSEKASQELFEKIAFENGIATKTPQLVKIGEQIVAGCGGVPLALKAIGGLLSTQRDELEWRKIEECSIWSVLDVVRSALKLSFNHLPSQSLKQCFAYCSVFLKDSVLKKNDMVQQWMAHGLLNPSRGSGLEMEDIGNNYFKILLQRSLLQEVEFDMYGNIISCKMHDLVHDFALEISKVYCLTTTDGELSDDIETVHLSIVRDASNSLNISGKKISRLRTLHLPYDFSNENFLANCKCEHLRVLTLGECGMVELPISIAKMKHLRYLDISRTCVRALPEFISELYNLQTLKLPYLASNFPKDFVSLVNLRHLYIQWHHNPPLIPRISQLTSLRTLSCFGISRDKGCQIEELCNLNHLEGSLTIVGLENVANGDDARRANLSRKKNIESLKLVWRPNNTGSNNEESILEVLQPHPSLKALDIVKFTGTSLPLWIPLLHNLISMKLQELINCEEIPPLGHLPFLKDLYISRMRSVKCVGDNFYGCQNLNLASADSNQTTDVVFPSLKELIFLAMSSLEEWSFVSSSFVDSFPCLQKLKISRCPCLTHLPEGLLSASIGLEILEIEYCDKLVSIPNLSSFYCLKILCISNCPELLGLPWGIEACLSLQDLTITCIASVIESLPHSLVNLRKLTLILLNDIIDHHVPNEPISNMTRDDIRGHDGPFSTLEDLTLIWDSRMESLPEQIKRFTVLKRLYLIRPEGLDTLPEWLSNFHFLESLNLFSSYSLANFPSVEVMRGLTNLKLLGIYNCSILKERCKEETGEEWHKIAHIPNIDVS